jgi:hypothetical protein
MEKLMTRNKERLERELARWKARAMDAESDLSDIVQAAGKGDCRALERAINDAKALLVGHGWQVCSECSEVWHPEDHPECPVCVEEEGGGE